MSKQAAKFAICLIGLLILGLDTNAFADECLTAPKDGAPQGSHWYYHLERSTKRKCWYLGSQGARTTTVASRKSAPSTQTEEASEPPLQPSVANARAELQPAAAAAAPPPVKAAAPQSPLLSPNSLRGDATADTADSMTLASRWPDPNAFRPSAPAPTEFKSADAIPAQIAPPQPTAATRPAEPQSAAQSSDEPIFTPNRILLCAIAVALALFGIGASMVIQGLSRLRRQNARPQRRDIWRDYESGAPLSPTYEHMRAPQPRRDMVPDTSGDVSEEVEYLLRRAARRPVR